MPAVSEDPYDLSDIVDPIIAEDDLPTNLRQPAGTEPDGPSAGGAPAAPTASTAGVTPDQTPRPASAAAPQPSAAAPATAVTVPTAGATGPRRGDVASFTPSQRKVYDDLMAAGVRRPVVRPGFVESLYAIIEDGTDEVLHEWTEPSMFLSKSQLAAVLKCEGQAVAHAANPPDFSAGLPVPTAVGIAAHRAIQLSHTHPGRSVPEYVRWAIEASVTAEEQFAAFWESATPGVQSDTIAQITSKAAVFTSSWPPLADSWEPRFEESMVAKIGRLKISAKPDLTLGLPKASGMQTMLICDLKTGSLNDSHVEEAAWHALVATLRNGVPPFRSVVYSLAEGEWTDPADVTEDMLEGAARRVVTGVVARVRVLTEARPPRLTPDRHCAWCPAARTCPESTVTTPTTAPSGAVVPLPDAPPPDELF